jgi:hypothetical protein
VGDAANDFMALNEKYFRPSYPDEHSTWVRDDDELVSMTKAGNDWVIYLAVWDERGGYDRTVNVYADKATAEADYAFHCLCAVAAK